MSSGERPIGAAKGKQPDTEALCQTPPPPTVTLCHFLHRCLSQPMGQVGCRVGACLVAWFFFVGGGGVTSLGLYTRMLAAEV